MEDPLVIGLVVVAVLLVVAAIYWFTKGKERKLEADREQAAEHRQEASAAAQRAGEAELTARRHAEEAEREKERALELERQAAEKDPDVRTP
jgi:type II secretory pathway pseudopilin PulG